ncbi:MULTISPECIES: helix-turn-helix domain-containing protein [Streptomyces]|uniref:helix-turn-helix domain-containing protein n=1 Tax=Streptomyces TaxID=1883 RepID=UPI00163B8816|nr:MULTISPECIES: helix-turn-helix transcriptional regulator [Streptomyces]MBC2876351.1 helix-turn-helix domain-containing protein [Streptomyces sp. TYQ1024]UBI35432.1 helix-turn-helix transcriptional regulator [Streptomyces mobaraensis]UKW28024.1 helix-turn-helix transcriptional regulator [Streptomyces sp. TYQ1024]
MPVSPSSSVEAARKAVADRLREIRRDAGLYARDVAERTGWYASKVSRLENATTPPSDDDIRAWCRACGAEDQAADIIAASRNANNAYVEWRRLQRTGLRRLQESYVPLFERTQVFRIYCSNVVPGLLQTEEYARALLSSITEFRETPDDVSAAVAARLARSHVIREGNHRFALLVEEAVLRHRVGDAATMAGQLGYLLSVMAFPSVSLGVIPFSAERRMWMIETFSVYDEEQAQVELLTAQVNVTAPSEVRQYLKAFGEYARLAVHGAEARSLITAAIDALG